MEKKLFKINNLHYFRGDLKGLLAGLLSLGLLGLGLGLSTLVQAQAWPNRAVRVIVTFPPGGTPDIYGRIMSNELSRLWGQSVVVENRTGASGGIGTELVAKSPAIRCCSRPMHPSPSPPISSPIFPTTQCVTLHRW